MDNNIKCLNWALFFGNQKYLLPVMIFLYLQNGLTIGDYIIFQSMGYILYFIIGIPLGYVSDHLSKKYVLIAGYLIDLCRISILFCGYGYWTVLTGEILMVFVRVMTLNICDSYTYEYLYEQNKSSNILKQCSNLLIYTSWGMALASLIGAFIYKFSGIYFVLVVEFVATSICLYLLLRLQKTQVYNRYNYSFSEIKKKAIVGLYRNASLFELVIVNAIMYFTTTLFVSTFQPLLQMSDVPAMFFGFVYFFNQGMRGLGGYLIKRIYSIITEYQMIFWASVAILVAFVLETTAFYYANEYLTLFTLFIVCSVIATQVANQTYIISSIHKAVDSNIRATTISIFNMFCRGLGGVFLALFRYVAEFTGYDGSYMIFAVVCGISLFGLLKKIKN